MTHPSPTNRTPRNSDLLHRAPRTRGSSSPYGQCAPPRAGVRPAILLLATALAALIGCSAGPNAASLSPDALAGARKRLGTDSERVYECRRIGGDAIRIDGAIDEPEWECADVLAAFQTAGPKPQPARKKTWAKLLWTDTHLLVAFSCDNDAVRSTGPQRDAELWNADAAEVFLCPQGAEKPYFEIDFNPDGAIYDTRILNWRYDVMVKHHREWAKGYNADVRCAVQVLRDPGGAVRGWSVEAAIPLKDIADADAYPKSGQVWLFGVFRAAQGADGAVEFSTWSPTYADFHRPYKFALLVFVE